MDDLSIRPYQAEGLEFLVGHERAALFDEPGLGKTMQALLSMRDLEPRGRILVVATGDAVGVWKDEITKWLGEEATVFSGSGASLEAFDNPHGFVITNYSRLAVALDLKWDGVIFDESQMLRNRNTRTLFKTVRAAFDNGHTGLGKVPVFFLSGTPIVKAAGDLWPILHLIDKHRWSSYWRFVQKYALVWQDQFGWHVEGVTNALGLWNEVSSVALRRTVAEVQPSLPPKIRQRVPLEMTSRQARAYRELEADMIAEVDLPEVGGLILTPSILARETRLRQVLVCPRLIGVDDDGAAVGALVSNLKEAPRSVVIFTPFAQAIPWIKARIEEQTYMPVYVATGGMGSRFAEAIARFNSLQTDQPGVLIATVQMGKSWQAVDVTHEVYFIGFDWNATTQLQAESRVHRSGQTHTVFAHYFVHADTHDLAALDVLAGKKRLADVILDRARHQVRPKQGLR